ncbi:TetR/AcrR family transcriptional regulator [Lichenicoccus sp.]|uniref:TetR/AcrR family transcriptional regulator n=1 Tax=Lichenicoccus sp. TaxID=2781899 RepID=UPI003D0B8842
MSKAPTGHNESPKAAPRSGRGPRADAQRNLVVLLQAAKEVFAAAGVDAPVRDIADRAGVGIGTVYRHFPRRADLIAAVFRQEMEACAAAVDRLAATHPPFAALAEGMQLFVQLAATKRGLAEALHSGDPAFEGLPARREQRLRPAFQALFQTAMAVGAVRRDIDADEFLNAAASLCMSTHDVRPDHVQRMVALLVDGLRHQTA